MTLIIGKKINNNCFISADNMVTYPEPVLNYGISSSGQVLKHNTDDNVFKILTPCDRCIMGIAGWPGGINIIAEKFKDKKETAITLIELKQILAGIKS